MTAGAPPLDPVGDKSADAITWSGDEARRARTVTTLRGPPPYPPTKQTGSKDVSLAGVEGQSPPPSSFLPFP
jgi:hypothetical protein